MATIVVVATGDTDDDVAVAAASDGRVIVEVSGQALRGPSGPCAYDPDVEQLSCPAGTAIRLLLGGGDDTADVAGGVVVTAFGGTGNDAVDGAIEVHGEEGDDRLGLTAGPGPRRATGGLGDDEVELSGTSGGDVAIDGGDGRDSIDDSGGARSSISGGAGVVRDDFAGDEGIDEISYATRTAPLLVDMRSRAATGGQVGEGDVYRDPIERIVVGTAADVVNGVPGVAHVVTGGSGDDTIRVTEPRGAGGDAAADSVRCQDGRDRVESDRLDTVGGDCERVLEDAKLTRALTVFRSKPRMSVSARGNRVSVRIGCDRDTLSSCSMKVVVRRSGTTWTPARVERVHVQPGRYRTIRLKATNAEAASALARSRRMLVVVIARDRLGRGSLAKHSATPSHPKQRGGARQRRTSAAASSAATGRAVR